LRQTSRSTSSWRGLSTRDASPWQPPQAAPTAGKGSRSSPGSIARR
jgi:hypothetical protein